MDQSSLPTNVAISSSLPPPPLPSLPSKKQKVKPTTAETISSVNDDAESHTVVKANKKRKTKINTDMAAERPEQDRREEIPASVSSDRKLSKKAKNTEPVSTDVIDSMQRSKISTHTEGAKDAIPGDLNRFGGNVFLLTSICFV